MGLELNSQRVEVRRIVNDALAQSLASGAMEIPDEWFQYLTESPEEAADLRRSRTLGSLKEKAKSQMGH